MPAPAENGAGPVRDGYGFDTGALDLWMRAHVDGYAGGLAVTQFRGGQSNPTYQLATLGGAFVLRRKPPGPLLKGAHAIEREARVLMALGRAGFPVAQVHGLCTDEGVIGTSFYIMELVAGRIVWDATFPDVPATDRPAYFDAMNRVIADLHRIDPVTIGLADFGRPGNYFERQIARWSRQYLADADAGRDPNMDRLVEWLPRHIPAGDQAAIVHGDFRCDNLVFHPTEPRILAVLDWELSTLGHPLADFVYHAMMYRMPPRFVAGLAGADLGSLGIPSEAAYVDAYCRRTGRNRLDGYDFAMAFNFFRMAAIFHGIKGRLARGSAVSAEAHERAEAFPDLAALAWEQAQLCEAR